jgi:catechol 2,3-dioxygenase-like lactoylglutathione lyase family enzyme
MLDHISLGTTDLVRAVAFYDASLAPLGVVRVWTGADAVGYGYPGGDEKLALKQRTGSRPPGAGFHLALTARTRPEVDAFFRAALAHGGTDQGAPGLRPHFGPNYYAAFVRDPEGHPLEVVCHEASTEPAESRPESGGRS